MCHEGEVKKSGKELKMDSVTKTHLFGFILKRGSLFLKSYSTIALIHS